MVDKTLECSYEQIWVRAPLASQAMDQPPCPNVHDHDSTSALCKRGRRADLIITSCFTAQMFPETYCSLLFSYITWESSWRGGHVGNSRAGTRSASPPAAASRCVVAGLIEDVAAGSTTFWQCFITVDKPDYW